MPGIGYPFPDPENEREREADRRAAGDYERLEEEGADLNAWEEELGWR